MDQTVMFAPKRDFTQGSPEFCQPTDSIQGAKVARNYLGHGIWFGQEADFWIFVHNNLIGLEINAQHTYPVSRILLDKGNNNVVVDMSVKGFIPEKTFKEFCSWCLETYLKMDPDKQKKLPPKRPDTGNILDYAYWIRTNGLIAKNEVVEYLTSLDPRSGGNCEKLKRAIQNLENILEFNGKTIKRLEGAL